MRKALIAAAIVGKDIFLRFSHLGGVNKYLEGISGVKITQKERGWGENYTNLR